MPKFFGAEKDGGEGLSRIDNLYQIGDIGRDLQALSMLEHPIGTVVYLAGDSGGLRGGFSPGRPLLMNDKTDGKNYEDKNIPE